MENTLEISSTSNSSLETLTPQLYFYDSLSNGSYDFTFSNLLYDNGISLKPTMIDDISICEVEIAPGTFLYASRWGNHVYFYTGNKSTGQVWNVKHYDVEPFFTYEILGNAYFKKVKSNNPKYNYYHSRSEPQYIEVDDVYGGSYDYNLRSYVSTRQKWHYLNLKVTVEGISHTITIKFYQPTFGEVSIDVDNNAILKTDFFGLKDERKLDFINKHIYLNEIITFIKNGSSIKEGKEILLETFFKTNIGSVNRTQSVIAIEKKYSNQFTQLKSEHPHLWSFYEWLKDGKTQNGVSNNFLLRQMLLSTGSDYSKIVTELQTTLDKVLSSKINISKYNNTREICLLFSAAEKKIAEKRSIKEWNFKETLKEKAEGLGIDPIEYPKLFQAVVDRKIDLSLFHAPQDPLDLINVDFSTWEKALNRKGWDEVIFSIAARVTNRNRFEKHITPYLSFLFRIEKYLKKHTGKKWAAFPTLVDSTRQLEIDDQNENGTVKRRSALTPQVDNDKFTITVPYAAIQLHGRNVSYCYSKHYFVFEENSIDQVSGTVVSNELEIKLNGRDDYGLMYYTLDGSVESQGYPTFLVIFERRKDHTHVHFHRVHPCRKKEGRDTPACRLIEDCYRYMAGNILPNSIFCQQGDLIFIKAEQPSELDVTKTKRVSDFESHKFLAEDKPVLLFENETLIKNRLGFIYAEQDFNLVHPEHEPCFIPAGYYEIRRARSWEANPLAIWSYFSD